MQRMGISDSGRVYHTDELASAKTRWHKLLKQPYEGGYSACAVSDRNIE